MVIFHYESNRNYYISKTTKRLKNGVWQPFDKHYLIPSQSENSSCTQGSEEKYLVCHALKTH